MARTEHRQKGISLAKGPVGLVLAAAAVVALVRGNGVFGIFAANGLTELVWGAGGMQLLLLSMLPALRRQAHIPVLLFGVLKPTDRPPSAGAGKPRVSTKET